MTHGPYHRLGNPFTQTLDTAKRQVRSGQLWGAAPRGSDTPTVQGYLGPLPQDRTGVEFMAGIEPVRKWSGEVRWTAEDGVAGIDLDASEEYAILNVEIVRTRYACSKQKTG